MFKQFDTRGGMGSGGAQHPVGIGYYGGNQLRIAGDDESAGGRGASGNGGGTLLLGNIGYGSRYPHDGGTRRSFAPVAGGGGLGRWDAGSEPLTYRQRHAAYTPDTGSRSGAGGGGGLLGPAGAYVISGNKLLGTCGADVDNTADLGIGDEAKRSPLFASIIGGRTEQALDDLFAVEH